jgi:hypothetical protein
MGEERNAYRIMMGKSKGRRLLGRPGRMWEDNIKIDFREIGWGDVGWIDLLQDRENWRALVNTVMNLQVPQNVEKFLSICATGDFSRRAQFFGVS